MLNISNNQLHKSVDIIDSKSGKRVFHGRYYKYFNRFLGAFAIVGIIILFLPWTQNITGKGNVTTLTPDQRPQTIQSPIPGRIETWFVREGDFVAKGDTIMQISEIKSEYFDPNLVERTAQQRDAKQTCVKPHKRTRPSGLHLVKSGVRMARPCPIPHLATPPRRLRGTL